MKRLLTLVLFLLTTLLLSGCLGGKSETFDFGSPANPPGNLKAVAGDGSVTLTWDSQPGVEYWVFYAPGEGVTTDNWDSRGGHALPRASSPYEVPFLENGQLYSFTVNGRIDGGPGGPGASSVTATPRTLGNRWRNASPRPVTSKHLNAIVYGAGRFIVAGDQGSLYSTPDFVDIENQRPDWTALTSPTTENLHALTHGNAFLAAGANGVILRSTDGASWTPLNSGTSKTLYGLATDGEHYVAVGETGTILISEDGITWKNRSSNINWGLKGLLGKPDLKAVLFTGTHWIAVGNTGSILVSLNAGDWGPPPSMPPLALENLNGITYGMNLFTGMPMLVAVGGLGAQLSSFDNGLSWGKSTINVGVNFQSISFGRRFVAVGSLGSIYTSDDGSQWTTQQSGSISVLNAVAYSESGNIAAVGNDGYIAAAQ